MALVFNLFTFIFCFIVLFCRLYLDHKRGKGLKYLRYFTTDSNILCGISALSYVVCFLLSGQIPLWAATLRLVGTFTVMLTFFTVLFFIGPLSGRFLSYYKGADLCYHLILPVITFISLVFYEDYDYQNFIYLWCFLPGAIYSTIYIYQTVFRGVERGGWKDFYGFNRGGKWPLIMTLMTFAEIFMCLSLRWLLIKF